MYNSTQQTYKPSNSPSMIDYRKKGTGGLVTDRFEETNELNSIPHDRRNYINAKEFEAQFNTIRKEKSRASYQSANEDDSNDHFSSGVGNISRRRSEYEWQVGNWGQVGVVEKVGQVGVVEKVGQVGVVESSVDRI